MQAKVTWSQRLSFTGTADTGFSLPLGAKPAVGGDDDGFRPMELIALGLAGCTAMDVISILQKKRQDIRGFEVVVNGVRADEHPRVFTQLEIEYRLRGVDIDQTAVERALELSETKYCPAQAMLGEVVPITLKITIEAGE
jgi:putative redox protein